MNDLNAKPAYIVTDDLDRRKNEMTKEDEQEQLLFNKLDELFGINVTLSPKKKTNGST